MTFFTKCQITSTSMETWHHRIQFRWLLPFPPFLVSGLVRPGADVVGLLLQFNPVAHAQAPDHLTRELHPAGPVKRRVLADVQRAAALLVGRRKATSSPLFIVNETPRSARTAVCPPPNVRLTSSAATMTGAGFSASSGPSAGCA
jgi:hypothetical protein